MNPNFKISNLIEDNVIWLAILISGVYWILDALIQVSVFDNGKLSDEIFSPSSHEIWTRVLVSFILIISGSLLQSYIFKRKGAEKTVKDAGEKFQTLFDSANDAIFLMEQDYFTDCNKKTLELFGCTRDQIIGQPPYQFSPEYQPDGQLSRKSAKDKINAALRGEQLCFEWQHCQYDGTLFDAEVSLKSLKLSGKTYIQAIVRDITQRKRAERAIKESEEKYRSLIDNACYSIILINPENRVTMINNFGARALGGQVRDFTGKRLQDIFPNNAGAFTERIKSVSESGEKLQYEDCADLPAGGKKWFWSSLQPLRDAAGKYSGMLLISHDITDQKIVEESLKENQNLLKSILESSGDGILVVNKDGTVTHTNERFAEMWRIPTELIESRDDEKLLQFVLDQLSDPEVFISKVKKLYDSVDKDTDQISFKDGRLFERYSFALIINDEIAGRVWNFKDITNSKLNNFPEAGLQRVNFSQPA